MNIPRSRPFVTLAYPRHAVNPNRRCIFQQNSSRSLVTSIIARIIPFRGEGYAAYILAGLRIGFLLRTELGEIDPPSWAVDPPDTVDEFAHLTGIAT